MAKATKKKAAKATTKKAAAPKAKATTKKAAAGTTTKKAATKRKPSEAFMRPYEISEKLGAVIGPKALARTEVVKKLWAYIKKHGLQDPKNKRNIRADDKLRAVFGKDVVNMFEMTKLVSKHLK